MAPRRRAARAAQVRLGDRRPASWRAQAQVGVSQAAIEAGATELVAPALEPYGDEVVAGLLAAPYLTRFPTPSTRRRRRSLALRRTAAGLGAPAAGVPLALVPMFADQGAQRRAGRRAAAIEAVLTEPSYRNAAGRIGAQMAAAPAIDEVLDRLADLLRLR